MFPREIVLKANQVFKKLKSSNLKFAAAESCTAGLVSAVFTEIPGSSQVLERGIVCYSNASKIELLTVPTFFIENYGAVSRETSIAMAEGMLLNSKADIAIAITGIAGPEGGSDAKPVGTVHFAHSQKGMLTIHKQHLFKGDRTEIRLQAAETAFDMLIENK